MGERRRRLEKKVIRKLIVSTGMEGRIKEKKGIKGLACPTKLSHIKKLGIKRKRKKGIEKPTM